MTLRIFIVKIEAESASWNSRFSLILLRLVVLAAHDAANLFRPVFRPASHAGMIGEDLGKQKRRMLFMNIFQTLEKRPCKKLHLGVSYEKLEACTIS